MARIVKEPDIRRSELITCAQQLFFTKGYESTSVSDIVNEAGVAKGTFYHYFHSKLAILEAMIEEQTAQVMVLLQEIIADETVTAILKWSQAFEIISHWKIERRAEMLAILRAVQQPENVVLQYKMRQRANRLVSPELAKIIAQGIEEGVFTTIFAEESAEFALATMQAFSDALTEILLCPHTYNNPTAMAERKVWATQTAVERILGAPSGSLPIIDTQTLSLWFSD